MDTVRGSTEWGFMDDWHFQTIDSCKPEAAFCPGNNCAGRRIIETIGKLEQYAAMKKKSKQAKREELTALSVLVHLLGDIHQPLHTSENADIGGNAVTITNRKQCFDRDVNLIFCKLHSYWDTNLVQAAMGKQTEKALVLELAKMTVDTGGDAESWIKESNALAKQKVRTYNGFTCTAFTPPDPVTGKKHVVPTKITITKGYDDAAKPIVKEQLAKAGQRLAAILNEIYK
jgi:hypothetical protein